MIILGKRNVIFLFITRIAFLLERKLNKHGKFSIIQNGSVNIMQKFKYLSNERKRQKFFVK